VSIYINYGVAGFVFTLLMLFALQEPVMLLLPVAFNVLLSRKLRNGNTNKVFHGLLVGFLTTGVFLIQWKYRQQVDWSCIKLISVEKAFVSYAFNLIFFSIILWETMIQVMHWLRFKTQEQ
jgi:hypothetical protein